MNTYTLDDIMALDQCEDYPRRRVEKLWGGRERLSLRDIASLGIPRDDVWWVFCQIADDRQRRHLACWCGRRHLERHGLWEEAPDVVREYLLSYGEREDIRDAARAAAWVAARAAAWYAARSAAWDAARSAAWDAAWAAAWDAAWDAARATARATARDAVWSEQIAYALGYLEEDVW